MTEQSLTEEAPRLTDEDLKVELRGYEVCRRVLQSQGAGKPQMERWAQVEALRPNQYGWNEARQTAKYLAEKHPNEVYRIRVIISLEPPPREVIADEGRTDPHGLTEAPTSESDARAAALLGLTGGTNG